MHVYMYVLSPVGCIRYRYTLTGQKLSETIGLFSFILFCVEP